MTSNADTYSSLTSSPRVDDLRDRHLAYYADLAERSDAELRGPDVAAWRRLLDSEYDNFTQAMDRAEETEQEMPALALADVIYRVNGFRGDAAPAQSWLERALAVGSTACGARAQVLLNLSAVAGHQLQDRPRAWQLVQEALAVSRQAGDKRFESKALRRMGTSFVPEVGGWEAACVVLEESLEAARQTGVEHEAAVALHMLAWRRARRDPEGFARDYQAALEMYRRAGDLSGAGWILYGMAWEEQDPQRAQELAAEALKIGRDLEDQILIICVRDMTGWLAQGRGNHDEALEIFESTLEEFRQPGRRWPLWWAVTWQLQSAALVDIEKGRLDRARAKEEEALEIAMHHGSKGVIRAATSHLAVITAHEGDLPKARKLAEDAVTMARELSDVGRLGYALRALAEVCLLAGDLPRARSAEEEALTIATDEYGSVQLVSALHGLALVSIAEGNLAEAKSHLDKASEIATGSWVEKLQTALARVARLGGELEESARLSAAAVHSSAARRHLPNLAAALKERAQLASTQGDAVGAARTLGSAAALRGRIGVPIDPLNRPDLDATVEALTSVLGEKAFRDAFDEGGRDQLDAAIESAT